MNTEKYQIDMCHGPLFRKIILFALPLLFSYILQLLFNAADMVVIGHYASHESMAAIGATININALVINIFIGLSIGSNVVVAQNFGKKDCDAMNKAVQTTMAISVWGGFLLMIIALLIARPLLILMATPENILSKSCTYLWICFIGIPFIMIYNFGCAILRAVGDTRRPMYFLIIAGVINILLNLFFVIFCRMDVAGVAWATTISNGISAILVLWTLCRNSGVCRLSLRHMRIERASFLEILRLGIPAGLQSSCFSVSNMLIQSSINSFGSYAIAGNTATMLIENLLYFGAFAYNQTAVSFVAQNLGGGKFKRIRRSLLICFFCSVSTILLLGFGFYFNGENLLRCINPDPEVIRWGLIRMKYLFTGYFICGFMEVSCGGLRGLGCSVTATVNSLAGACLFRIWWILWVFPKHRTIENLLISYPVSWGLVAFVGCTLLFMAYRKLLHEKYPRIRVPYYHFGIVRILRQQLSLQTTGCDSENFTSVNEITPKQEQNRNFHYEKQHNK